MTHDRRTVLSALGLALTPALAARAAAAAPGVAPRLRLVPFEDAVRAAFAGATEGVRRVAVGDCEAVRAGVQGCVNHRPFAGFPAGRLRIVRTATEPGPAVGGVRLFVTTADVACTAGENPEPSRPLDFACLPPAAELVISEVAPRRDERGKPVRSRAVGSPASAGG